MPAMQSSLEVLAAPLAFARRRQSWGIGWLLEAQHWAAMSVLGNSRDTSRFSEEVTFSSPG
eukprot:CAMPEP_0119355656 /NCGR_PEP_ID=MMETSP1334-20130426/4462_1 /TAXON_ID=127549 /ORGANISM="Calcidiscus leptoporus, Strain RCC1130" /LENGTH=60 /DNA_ID=CAMNT_0007369533 /DNA_START=140 /DNA_END=318 /DNA_ORIENTATION=-